MHLNKPKLNLTWHLHLLLHQQRSSQDMMRPLAEAWSGLEKSLTLTTYPNHKLSKYHPRGMVRRAARAQAGAGVADALRRRGGGAPSAAG